MPGLDARSFKVRALCSNFFCIVGLANIVGLYYQYHRYPSNLSLGPSIRNSKKMRKDRQPGMARLCETSENSYIGGFPKVDGFYFG